MTKHSENEIGNERYDKCKMSRNQLSEGWPYGDIYTATIGKDVR